MQSMQNTSSGLPSRARTVFSKLVLTPLRCEVSALNIRRLLMELSSLLITCATQALCCCNMNFSRCSVPQILYSSSLVTAKAQLFSLRLKPFLIIMRSIRLQVVFRSPYWFAVKLQTWHPQVSLDLTNEFSKFTLVFSDIILLKNFFPCW